MDAALLGRERELDEADAAIARLTAGESFVWTVAGEPGSGRSSFLQMVRRVAQRSGATVLACRGAPPPHMPFEALGALVRPLDRPPDRRLDVLGGHLAAVLRNMGTFPGAEPPAADVRRALLHVLCAAAEPAGLVIVVDDVELVDSSTTEALAFVLGRLGVDGIGAFVAGHVVPPVWDGVATRRVQLRGLPADVLAAIVGQVTDAVPAVCAACAEWAGGNPLLAIELGRSFTDAERRGTSPLPAVPRVGLRVVEHLRDRLGALTLPAQRALVVVAADRSGRASVVRHALAALGEHHGGLDEAERSGIITLGEHDVQFAHPLVRPLAYHLVAAASRRAAHRALAAALDRPTEAVERVWQLVHSCVGPDEEVAAMLELVAEQTRRRGARLDAATMFERAAELTGDPTVRRRRWEEAEATRVESDTVGHAPATVVLPAHDDRLAALSPAERRVADAVGRGMTNREAAEHLFLSVKTVDFHLQTIYRKLVLRSRTELAVLVAGARSGR